MTRGGSKSGLLVTRELENRLGKKEQWSLPEFLISRDFVARIEEEVDSEGIVTKPIREDAILEAVKQLLELGVRILVISFRNSHVNPENEKSAKEIVNTYYFKHYANATHQC